MVRSLWKGNGSGGRKNIQVFHCSVLQRAEHCCYMTTKRFLCFVPASSMDQAGTRIISMASKTSALLAVTVRRNQPTPPILPNPMQNSPSIPASYPTFRKAVVFCFSSHYLIYLKQSFFLLIEFLNALRSV